MKRWKILELGGPKSGHWGHAGGVGGPKNPGGSVPRSVAMSLKTGRDWKERQAAKVRKFGSSGVDSVKPLDPYDKGVNDSVIMEFADGSKGIFKSENMKHGSMEGEILAYELSESLGWGIVPETIEYTYGGVKGSLQKWEDGEVAMGYKGAGVEKLGWHMYSVTDPALKQDYDRMRALDSILHNRDRHDGNWLIGKDKLWAIDNGGAFYGGMGGKKYMRVADYSPGVPSVNAAAAEVKAWAKTPKAAAYVERVTELMGPEYGNAFNDFVGSTL